MRKLLLSICCLGCALWAQAKDFTQYVNPLMGTLSSFELSTGNTYPAIARPWGMNFWTPQTGKMGDGWQYVYTANKIRGFKQTHQPSPWINDYGQFSIMPVTGKPEFDEDKRASWFSHKGEVALPYYYKVYLAEHDVVTEFTPTERAVLFRFTFPENENSYVVVDAFDKGSYIKIIPEQNKIIGYTTRNSGGVPDNFKNYFVIEFDKPFSYQASVADGALVENQSEQTAGHAGAIIGFKTRKGEIVHARVASSFISFEQADRNLKELGSDSFETLVQKGQDAWNQVLGKIEVDGGNLDQYRTFYSCLYRSVLFPRAFFEFDEAGNPVHYSPYNGEVLPGYMYTDTGFWDTFRCLFPFLNLMYPSVNKQIQEGLINTYKESGFFPEWASPGHRGCMIGNNSASILADAYLKGIKVDDVTTLYEGLIHGTKNVHPEVSSTGRLGYEYYNELGYVPYDVKINENTARTLEYAYDDFALAQMAKALGKTDDYQALIRRAANYRNVIDPRTGYAQGRHADGTFLNDANAFNFARFITEGAPCHYTWYVPQDPYGLMASMGGKDKYVAKLDSMFSEQRYWHGNEPCHQVAYMFNYAGEPWKTQRAVRHVMETEYLNEPGGLSGNDDAGQMSAWYMFAAMGFYPVCPGTPYYILASPSFPSFTLNLESGKKFTVKARNASQRNIYIQSATLNGKPYTRNYITHQDIVNGGVMEFVMGDKPNKEWGTAAEDCPPTVIE